MRTIARSSASIIRMMRSWSRDATSSSDFSIFPAAFSKAALRASMSAYLRVGSNLISKASTRALAILGYATSALPM